VDGVPSRSTLDPVPHRRPGEHAVAGEGPVDVRVQLGRVQIVLWLLTGSLVTLNVLVSLFGGLHLLPYSLTRFFDGNDRESFLSGTKTTLLLLAAVLMAGCTLAARRRGDPSARGWRLLALVACFTFADELTGMHVALSDVLRTHYHFRGLGRYAWALAYLPVAVTVLLVLVRDLRRMPRAVRARLLPGLVLYAIGIIGLEPVRALVAEQRGDGSLAFTTMAATADGTALVGLTFVVCAVLVAASRLAAGFTVVLAADPTAERG
jgi:hypothetical protein